MKKRGYFWGIILLLVVLMGACTPKQDVYEVDEAQLYHLVDPFIGTGAHGHTYPGVAAPHGMVQLSPDSRWDGWDACSGYHYSDDSLHGFSHTHLSGTGCSDLSDLLFIPTIDVQSYRDSIASPTLPKQSFSHEDEEAHAGYYSVLLGSDIRAELTATSLIGAHKYTFPKGENGYLVLDLVSLKRNQMKGASLSLVSDTEVCGHQVTNGWVANQHVYFYAQFSSPIQDAELYLDGALNEAKAIEGDSVRGILSFGEISAPLEIFVGISQTSIEAAKENLQSELKRVTKNQTFDEVRSSCEQEWNTELSKVLIPKGNPNDLKTFYTALYHAFLTPTRVSDAGGSYRGLDNQIHQTEEGRIAYSTFSLWDTYRALHPLTTLLDYQRVQDYVSSILSMYEQSGELPIWPLASGETRTMIGYHAVSVMADAYLRGITKGMSLDEEKMLQAMVTSSLVNKKGAAEYEQFGMVPSNRRNESVSCTLEYSYDDWCIAQVAQAMGNSEVYEKYSARAQNFINLFDGATKYFRGRHEDGTWGDNFNPYEVSKDFTEANAWQYRFGAQHDIYGMIQLHGGEENFAKALDDLFGEHTDAPEISLQDITGLVGQYAHGNEPSHHIAYLYNYVGMPWKTQELTRRLLKEQYSDTPEGIAGNEDCGQMSAWYIFSALGMYPVTPGSGEYVVTTPLFEEVTLKLSNGNSLKIKSNNPDRNKYIKSIILNGEKLEQLYLTYEDLMNGGELEFVLSDQPNKQSAEWKRPYSQTQEAKPSPVFTPQDLSLFTDSISVELKSATPSCQIFYTLDASVPTTSSTQYTDPITLTEDGVINAIAILDGVTNAPVQLKATKADFHKPADVVPTVEGIQYQLFSGWTDSTQTIEKNMKLVGSGNAEEINLEMREQEEKFALIFEGYIEIEEEGVYEFEVTSDDGSVLKIWGEPIVMNDGSHSYMSASGKMALSSGFHPFELRYWQGYEGKGLQFLMRKRGDKEYTTPKLYRIK